MNKYEIVRVIDEGAYGIVLKGRHKDNGTLVAIKKFKETEDDQNIRKNIQRQVRMLRMLKSEYVVQLKEAFKRKGRIYLVFEHLDKNLLNLLEQNVNGLEPELIRNIIYQLIKSLSFLHYNNIVHRDIKPQNILLSNTNQLKLCDFGFARPLPSDQEKLTDYVATRWYRPPQLLVCERYGTPIDIWAVGCIMGQLIDGQALFPGEDYLDQLYLIQKTIGPLTTQQRQLFLKNPRFLGQTVPETQIRQLQTLQRRYLGKLSKNALNFMKACLKMNPKVRLTADEAIHHPYLQDLSSHDIKRNIKERRSGQQLRKEQFVRKEQVVSDSKIPQNTMYTVYNSKGAERTGQRIQIKMKPKGPRIVAPAKFQQREKGIPMKTVYPSAQKLGVPVARSEEKKGSVQNQLPNIGSRKGAREFELMVGKAGSREQIIGDNNINLIYNTNNFNYVMHQRGRKK